MLKYGAAAMAAIATLALVATPAQAGVLDNVQIKLGASYIAPDENADISVIGGDVEISDETAPTLAIEYFFSDHISMELLCCIARHDVAAVGTAVGPTGRVDLGEISHFPPTVTVKYRWTNLGRVEPYVGAGVNYTHFFDEELPAGGVATSIDYDDSFGAALQAGADIRVNDHWAVNVDVRRIWIDPEVTIMAGATRIDADVEINPTIFTIGVGYRF